LERILATLLSISLPHPLQKSKEPKLPLYEGVSSPKPSRDYLNPLPKPQLRRRGARENEDNAIIAYQ